MKALRSRRELLTLQEAADELDCSVETVKRRIAAGLLPVFRDGRRVRVRRVDLERYIAERTSFVTPGERSRRVIAGHSADESSRSEHEPRAARHARSQ